MPGIAAPEEIGVVDAGVLEPGTESAVLIELEVLELDGAI